MVDWKNVPKALRAMVAACVILGGCCLIAGLLLYLFDVNSVRDVLDRSATQDFSQVSGGCQVDNQSFVKIEYCTAYCGESQQARRTVGCDFYAEYTGVVLEDNASFVDTLPLPDYYHVGCGVEPQLPADAPRAGSVSSCWSSTVDPVPGAYSCRCTKHWRQCPAHAGRCTTLTDPAERLDAAQTEVRGSLLTARILLIVGPALIALVAPLLLVCWQRRHLAKVACHDDGEEGPHAS